MALPLILPGFSYLANQRKLLESTMRHFNLGYMDPNGNIYMPADFTGTLPTMPAIFRNSCIFPIFNLANEVIAVSVKPLSSNGSKYINTSYEKADHLWGLNFTWQNCLAEQSVYIVEGNFDILQMWQAGVKNVVALLGSNCSYQQLCLLSRFSRKVTLLMDNDKAGNNFIEKFKNSVDSRFYDFDLSFTYLELPNDIKDADEYFKKYSIYDFKQLNEKEIRL